MGFEFLILKTYVRRSNFILYFSIFLEHFVLSMSTVRFIESFGYNTSFSNLHTYEQVPAPINPIDLILLEILIS